MTNKCKNLCRENQASLSVKGANLKIDDQESKAAYLCLVVSVQYWVMLASIMSLAICGRLVPGVPVDTKIFSCSDPLYKMVSCS